MASANASSVERKAPHDRRRAGRSRARSRRGRRTRGVFVAVAGGNCSRPQTIRVERADRPRTPEQRHADCRVRRPDNAQRVLKAGVGQAVWRTTASARQRLADHGGAGEVGHGQVIAGGRTARGDDSPLTGSRSRIAARSGLSDRRRAGPARAPAAAGRSVNPSARGWSSTAPRARADRSGGGLADREARHRARDDRRRPTRDRGVVVHHELDGAHRAGDPRPRDGRCAAARR